jgi:hypothetical protein
MEESQIIEIWDVFKEYVPDKNKEVAANHYVDFLLGKDVEFSVLEGLLGFDHYLDSAIDLVLEDARSDDESEDDDNWGYDEDDEDY